MFCVLQSARCHFFNLLAAKCKTHPRPGYFWVYFFQCVCSIHLCKLKDLRRFATDRRWCCPWSPWSSVPAPRSPAAPKTSCLTWRSPMLRLKLGPVHSRTAIPWYVWPCQTQWRKLGAMLSLAAALWQAWRSHRQWDVLDPVPLPAAARWWVWQFQIQWPNLGQVPSLAAVLWHWHVRFSHKSKRLPLKTFLDCRALTSITIPDSVASMTELCCSSLSVKIPWHFPALPSTNGEGFLELVTPWGKRRISGHHGWFASPKHIKTQEPFSFGVYMMLSMNFDFS